MLARTESFIPYDFRRPRQPRADACAALEPIHREFASSLSIELSTHLGGTVEASLTFVEQVAYDDFLHSLGETTCLSVLLIDPPGAQACLDLELPILYPMLDRLLGGNGADLALHRPLTQIEQGLARGIIKHAVAQLAETWNRTSAEAVAIREQSMETTPRGLSIMPGEELVHVARFEIRVGNSVGRMSLCMPLPVVEALQQPIRRLPSPGEKAQQKANLSRNILDASVELRAMLAETKVRLSDLLTLEVGDVITTDKPAVDDEVPVQVQGIDKFAGRMGHLRGTLAVRITHVSDASDSSEIS